jgi:hypothetical protein
MRGTTIRVQTSIHGVALAMIALATGELALVETWVRSILFRAANIHVVGVLSGRVTGSAGIAVTGIAIPISIPATSTTTSPSATTSAPTATPTATVSTTPTISIAVIVPITAPLTTTALEALRRRAGRKHQ